MSNSFLLFFFFVFYSVRLRMCIFLFSFFFVFTNTGISKLTFCCSVILKESSVSILACIIKCRYLSGSKKKHTKAPVSLRFTTLEGKKKKKRKKRHSIKSESGTPAITEVFDRVPSGCPLVYIQRCYDGPCCSNIACTPPS